MKVLMLSWEYAPHVVGGLGKHVTELVPELIDDGVEVHLVTPALDGGLQNEPLCLPDGRPATNGSTLYRVPPSSIPGDYFTNTWHDNIEVEEFAAHLVRHVGGFDLIHNHDWLSGFAATAIKHDFHIPLLTTIHATEMGRHQGNLYSEMQRSIHMAEWWLTFESWRVIACSASMAWEIETYFNAPRDKVDVIPNGVNTRPFDALKGKDLSEFRAGFAGPDECIVYYVGRIVPEKGLWVLVESVPQILKEMPNVKFIIAGNGAHTDDLRAKASELGLGEAILFPGRIPDSTRDALFKVADCAVFPSLYEPFGIVALEAMAAGCPVVVSDVGGLSEVMELHETGIKVYPNDAGSLAWGILHTLQHPDWSEARARNAERVVRANYTWHQVADRTIDVYERIAHEARQGDWAYRY